MKKITFLISMIIASLGYSQTNPINFEVGGNGASWTWNTFENPSTPCPPLLIIPNPDMTGANTSATVASYTPVVGAPFYAGTETALGSPLGPFTLNATNSTVKILVWKPIISNVGIKFATASGASTGEINVANSVVNQWEELTFNFASKVGEPSSTDIAQIVVFIDSQNGRTTDNTCYFDNIRFSSAIAVVPTCSDGIQNGDETGVDCGGATCPVCLTDPVVSAVAPTIPVANVLSVYSETYPAANSVTSFNFNAFQGSGTMSEVDIENNGNKSGKMLNLQYYGAQWTAANISAYTYVHLDYYAKSSTNFNFFLIDQTAGIGGGSPAEPRYSFGGSNPNAPLVTGSWQSVFIPLSHFANFNTLGAPYDLNDIFQWKFDGNGTIYFDNIYFSTTNLATDNFEIANVKMYPNPANNVLNIEAKFTIENVSIYNLLGQEVISESVNKQSTSLNITNLQSGVYVVKTSIDGKIASSRLIKE